MADSAFPPTLIGVQQGDKEITANGLFDAASPSMFGGRRQEACIGLRWGYYGGRIAGLQIPDSFVDLAAGFVNYLVCNRTTGAITASVLGYNWCDPANYARLYRIDCGSLTPNSYEDHRFGGFGIFRSGSLRDGDRVLIELPLGDAGTAVTTGNRKVVRRAQGPMILTDVRACLATASSGAAPSFDVNVGGLSALGTNLTIDASETTSTTAAAPFALADLGDVVAEDDEVSIDVDTAGTSAAGLVVTLIGIRSRTTRYRDLQSLCMRFDGLNGGILFPDDSPRPKTITNITSVVTSTTTAPLGASSSGYWNGTASITLNPSSEFNLRDLDWAIGHWTRHDSTANSDACLWTMYSGAVSWGLFANRSTRTVSIADSSGGVVATSAGNAIPASTNWHHVKTLRSGTTLKVIVDNTQAISFTYNQLAFPGDPSLRFGLNAASSQSFTGYLRDFVMIKGAAPQSGTFAPPRRLQPVY